MKTSDDQKKIIAFTGGGSGGHVLPIASLLEYAQQDTQIQQKCKALYRFGERGGLEEKKTSLFEDMKFVAIYSGKVRRYISVASILLSVRDFFRLIIGFFQSLWYLHKYKIDIVFCKGGYVVIPVCFAAKLLRIPIIVHESDTHVGLANRVAAKLAKTIFTGFDGVFYNAFTVGQILSPSLSTPKKVPLKDFDNTKTTILCMGGAQGADKIFAMIPKLIEQYGEELQYIVLTGLRNKSRQEKLEEYKNVRALGFLTIEEVACVMNLSDISLTRGSMTSLEEQQLFGIKKIIIPLPFTGGNHQETNADWCVEHRGDQKVLQDKMQQEETTKLLDQWRGYKKPKKKVSMNGLFKAHATIRKELLS